MGIFSGGKRDTIGHVHGGDDGKCFGDYTCV